MNISGSKFSYFFVTFLITLTAFGITNPNLDTSMVPESIVRFYNVNRRSLSFI
jgi:hypothetical protein